MIDSMIRLRYFKITWESHGRQHVHVTEHNNPRHVREKIAQLVGKKDDLLEMQMAKVEEISKQAYEALLSIARLRAA